MIDGNYYYFNTSNAPTHEEEILSIPDNGAYTFTTGKQAEFWKDHEFKVVAYSDAACTNKIDPVGGTFTFRVNNLRDTGSVAFGEAVAAEGMNDPTRPTATHKGVTDNASLTISGITNGPIYCVAWVNKSKSEV